ncbi:MAG: sugar phosphate isomerase/epimerase [Chloroflexi bacterium]|nr:sugar phosphate isomerase/epimerase [Chloroflexota bacterium]MCL5274260.1 sugar phosphate isomerase/epimerase [Chloroflexota bacterium]
MRFGCCVGALEQIEILARAGYDFCELPAGAVQPFDDDAAARLALRALEQAPLRSESFNVLVPSRLPLVGPNVDHAALRAYLSRAFRRMVRLGGEVVVLGSGGARRIPDGFPRDTGLAQLAGSIGVAVDEAQRAGITLALEHLNRGETNTINSVAEAQAFAAQYGLGERGMRLLIDLHHIEVEHEPLEHVKARADLIAHVHVADGGRRQPGAGGYDYAGFMEVLRTCGYDRRISAECQWDDLVAQAADALAFMRRSWENVIH